MAQTPRLIDGIVLTKFDTIDDKVNVRLEGGVGILRKGAEAARKPWLQHFLFLRGRVKSGLVLIGCPLSPLRWELLFL